MARGAEARADDETPDEQSASKVVPLREGDAQGMMQRKAEGGFSFHFTFDLPKLPSVMAVQTWTHQQMINGALIAAVVLMAAFIVYREKFSPVAAAGGHEEATTGLVRPNVKTGFNPTVEQPAIASGAFIDPLASVIGNVSVGARVYVAPFASIRGDEGQPIVIGEGSNVQDGVVLHALETFDGSEPVEKNLVTVDGKKFAVYVGKNVSMAHQSQVHGPAAVGDNTFVGMQALVFKAVVGKNVVIEPGAKVIGVTIPEGRYVTAGSVVTSQAAADALPKITPDYAFATLNNGVLEVNHSFADAYLGVATGEKPAASSHGSSSSSSSESSSSAHGAASTSASGH
ncbi:MAG: hypothetical protein U0547_10895 [Dehalococcoidia bacterium]